MRHNPDQWSWKGLVVNIPRIDEDKDKDDEDKDKERPTGRLG